MINNLNHELTNKCSSIVLVHLKGGKNFPSKNKLINKEVITLEQLITYIACNISSNTKVPSDIVIASMLKLKPTKVKYQCYMKRLGKEIKKKLHWRMIFIQICYNINVTTYIFIYLELA